ncbi:hypothetical protein JKY72_02955 [Candidatus Gracilibacteria bacterium]|nr:hypothetical protein [Candidatus Gracilibacteria bacterium]
MSGSTPQQQLVDRFQDELVESAKTEAIMKLALAVDAELAKVKVEGREKTAVEVAIGEITTNAMKALARV